MHGMEVEFYIRWENIFLLQASETIESRNFRLSVWSYRIYLSHYSMIISKLYFQLISDSMLPVKVANLVTFPFMGPNLCIKEHCLVESAEVLMVVLFATTTTKFKEQGLSFGCKVFEVPFTNSKSWSDSEVKNSAESTNVILGKSWIWFLWKTCQ